MRSTQYIKGRVTKNKDLHCLLTLMCCFWKNVIHFAWNFTTMVKHQHATLAKFLEASLRRTGRKTSTTTELCLYSNQDGFTSWSAGYLLKIPINIFDKN